MTYQLPVWNGQAKNARSGIPIWRDRGINRAEMEYKYSELVGVNGSRLYGEEGWTLTKADEKRIESAEL